MIGMGSIVIFVVFLAASLIVSWQLKSRFKKYSQIPVNNGMSGRDVAEKMLRDNGISDVRVISVKGQLTDHYNPEEKTVNLSEDVFFGKNVSAAAVAAHECGHAVQHAHEYAPLKLRTALVPLQNISAKILNFIFIAMFFGMFFIGGIFTPNTALILFIICYGVFTLFAFITLPVEVDASRRALTWLTNSGVTNYSNHDQAKDALKWAAYTYLVAALSSLAMLIYYIMLFTGRRD
jgi:Zn-dependent membrane protease YugP